MKSNLFKSCLLATAVAAASQTALAGEAVFYVTEDGEAVDSISVTVDGQKKLVGKNGFVVFDLGGGNHSVELSQFGEWAGEFEFSAAKNQNAEIQVEMIGGEAVQEVSVYTPGQEQSVALGKVSGYLESDETGGGVEGAIISVEGLELSVTTDGEGYYELEIPRGEYTLNVAHPNYGNREVKNLRVISNVATNVNLNMSMSGDSMIEEVVAVGSYIPSTATAQQRDASGVLDAIGADQFSRFGDSNAASALKRVSGVTIADGKYAVVRGLNERYTSILFNGASLPSPDPTRRVVPLDLFPSGVISSINVEKTGRANRLSDSAGAAIDIISREAPDVFEGKLSVSVGGNANTIGESATVQKTSGSEIFGIRSSDRDLSQAAKDYSRTDGATAVTGEAGAALVRLDQWETENKTLQPDTSVEVSGGDLIGDFDFGLLAVKATGRYSNKWKLNEIDRATYSPLGNGAIQEADEYVETRAVNDIDLSGAIALSLTGDEYAVTSNTMLLRQTQIDSTESVGVRGEYRAFTVERDYMWQEREFFMQQFTGDLQFSEFMDTDITWGATFANAKLDSPDTRSYTLQDGSVELPIDNVFNPLSDDRTDSSSILMSSAPKRDFTELDEDGTDFQVHLDSSLFLSDSFEIRTKAGVNLISRERNVDSFTYSYSLTGGENVIPSPYDESQDISDVINNDSFTDGVFEVSPLNDFKASYTGEWTNTSYYLMPSIDYFDVFKFEAGVRVEDSELIVETSVNPVNGQTILAKVEDSDVYPSLNLTVTPIEDLQLRFAYYGSVNRPDFREIAPTQFTDTVTGDKYLGNENLKEATVTNLDLRAEYYFSDDESVTFAFFRKDFKDAIERTSTIIAGSSNDVLYSFANSGDSFAQGVEFTAAKAIEFDALSLRVSGNVSIFDTEIDIYNFSGNLEKTRQLQGQPELLANVQFALDELESGREYTLIINHTGESLHAVSADPLLGDEMKLARTVIDLNFKQPLMQDELELKASVSNLTDAKVEQQQSGRMTKRYSPGMNFKVGITYNF